MPSSRRRLARRHHHRVRQLRCRLRAGAPRQRAVPHQPHGRRRGHPRHRAGAGHRLPLGELPRVPRRARRHAAQHGHRHPDAARRAALLRDGRARRGPRASADAAEIGNMGRLLDEALAAGALGFSTSRTTKHRAADGRPTPSLSAGEPELHGLAQAMRRAGRGVLQVNSDFGPGEFEILRGAAAALRPAAVGAAAADPTTRRTCGGRRCRKSTPRGATDSRERPDRQPADRPGDGPRNQHASARRPPGLAGVADLPPAERVARLRAMRRCASG